jgi:lipopolysaccharide/colanic/teichoic acid biosynthesis glycosyltransferase
MDQTLTVNASPKKKRVSSAILALKQLPKRMIDIVVSALGLLFLLPVFLLVAIMIKRDSPGPVFFWCQRMGRHCRPFRMLKFRTMYELPNSYQGPPITCDGDKRITPIGQWLRDTKIQEWPEVLAEEKAKFLESGV